MTTIRLRYVQRYRDQTGKMRHYFRRKGQLKIALPGLPGSREFMKAYQSALCASPVPTDRHASGTLGRLATDYYRSAEYVNLKDQSKRAYRLVLDPIIEKDGHRLVADMRRKDARRIIEDIGKTRPAMANLVRSVLRLLLSYAVAEEWRDDNPIVGIKPYKGGTHHTWTDDELMAFENRWPVGTREHLAYSVLLYTGQRGGDAVKMVRPQSSAATIDVVQEKTETELHLPIHPNLWSAIKATPAKGLTLIGDANGRPIGRAALTNFMKRAAKAAGLPAYCVPHGLRKAMSRRLADRGASSKQIASITGHRSLKEIERYTEAADQRRLSVDAMAKLEGTDGK